MGTVEGEMAVHKLRREVPEETRLLILDLGLPELGGNTFLLFKPPVYGILLEQPKQLRQGSSKPY